MKILKVILSASLFVLSSCGNPLGQNVKGTLINDKFSPGDVPVVTPTPETPSENTVNLYNKRIKVGSLPMGYTRATGTTLSASLSVSTSNRNLVGDSVRSQISIK